MKKTIAVYRNIQMGYTFIAECVDWDTNDAGIRLSEPIEVEFDVSESGDNAVRSHAIKVAQKAFDKAKAVLDKVKK